MKEKYKKRMLYFASDFHLGLHNQDVNAQEQKILNFLEHARKNNAEKIFLVGDVFDFWFEYKRVVPKGYFRLFSKLYDLHSDGIKVYMFKGNHDMWMLDYFEKECGVEIISDELIFEHNNKKFFVHHGDGLGPGDRSYKVLKKVFRSRLNRWLFSRLHPNFALGMGAFLSNKSRLAKKDFEKENQYLGDDKEFLTQFCKAKLAEGAEIDYFIFGHRHLPINLNIGQSKYINLGEWIHCNSYAVFDGCELKLLYWND